MSVLPFMCELVLHFLWVPVVIARFSQLHSNRPPLPNVPAVYFVSPNLANVRRIAQDLETGLYESYHLNFVEPLPRSLLEELAAVVARDGTGELVEQVCRKCRTHRPQYIDARAYLRFWINIYLLLLLRRLYSPSCHRQVLLHRLHRLMLPVPPLHPCRTLPTPSSTLLRRQSNR